MPPYQYYLAKLCRAYEKLPWEIDPDIPKGDLPSMLIVLDIISYEDAWKQYLSDPENFGDSDKLDMIDQVREMKKKLWPKKDK